MEAEKGRVDKEKIASSKSAGDTTKQTSVRDQGTQQGDTETQRESQSAV